MTCASLLLSKVMLFGLGNYYGVSGFSFFLSCSGNFCGEVCSER